MRRGSSHRSQDRDNYKEFERKRRKHRTEKSYEDSEVEEVSCGVDEVIEIHGSSSEEEAVEESEVPRKHKHSHKHRKHRGHSSKQKEHENHPQSHGSQDGSDETEDSSRRKRHKTKGGREDDNQVLLENVKSSRHRTSSHDNERHPEGIKIKEERDSRERSRHRDDGNSRARSRHEGRSSRDRHHARSRARDDGPRVKEEIPQIKEENGRVKEERTSRERSRFREESSRFKEERRDSTIARVKNEENVQRERRGSRERNDNRSRHGRGRGRREEENEECAWGQGSNSADTAPVANSAPGEKDKPDFKLSGKLTEDRNTFNGVVIKYSEPPEARMPKKRWRLYQFKGNEALPTLYIHRQSAYLIGRDRKVVDLPVDHPSCSKQHAALQYRLITFERPNGTIGKQIRLYVIDLESANGTFINGKKIDPKKYVELLEKDVIKFGFSSREYVLLHEQSKDDEPSDDE